MKVLLAADIFPPESGGPATYVVNLANALVDDGVGVEIVSLNPNSDASRATCKLYHVSKRNKILKYFEYFYLIWKHSKDVDVIYAMGPVNAGLSTCMASRLRGKKFVVKVVGDYAWEQGVQRFGTVQDIDTFQNKKIRHSLPVYILRWIQSFVVRNAARVIVPSVYLKGIVEGWGAEKEKVEVIYNAVEFKNAEPMRKPEGEKWLVSVGRLTSWKGMDTLIEIMPDLLKEIPNLKLKIVGDGPVIEDLRFKIEDLRLENSVELTGNLPKGKTLAFMASADVFVLNSGYEGLSHVLIEAHSQGVPTLASRAGGNKEMVFGEALFELNNKEEIKKKILDNINVGKGESKSHGFLGDMIKETKKVLEEI